MPHTDASSAAHTIHHVLEIDAPRGAVFSALTRTDALASWWTTEVRADAATTSGADAATLGAIITFTFHPAFSPRLRIAEVEPNARLVWQGVGGHDAWGPTTITFNLDAAPIGTRVRFWHHMGADRTEDEVGGANFRWGQYLNSLRLLCETGYGHPFHPTAA